MRVVTAQIVKRQIATFNTTQGVHYSATDVLKMSVAHDFQKGCGFAIANFKQGETSDTLLAEAKAVKSILEAGLCNDRQQILQLLPPGGARQAIDIALWDLDCQFEKTLFWQKARLQPRQSLRFLELGHSSGEEHYRVVAAASLTTFRIRIDSVQDAEHLLKLSARFPRKRWIVSVGKTVGQQCIYTALTKMNADALVALEWPANRWEESLGLQRALRIPFSIVDADVACPDFWMNSEGCQYVTLSLANSGGLTQIINRIKEATLRGVGTILCDTELWAVNPHALTILFSLTDWVGSAQPRCGSWQVNASSAPSHLTEVHAHGG